MIMKILSKPYLKRFKALDSVLKKMLIIGST